ncbi:MAG: VOC family protein [Deltaproteobacteria bacterium]|nr:VOC family protein [Deltaproteobacteria bacterium]
MNFLLAALSSIMMTAPEGSEPATSQTKPSESATFQTIVRPSRAALVPTPAELLPVRIAATCLYTTHLEAQREWYEKMLGFKVSRAMERDGRIFEYIMETPGGSTILTLAEGIRPPGYNSYTRLVLEVPNARALAEHIHSQRSSMLIAAKNIVYMVIDPEGNQIEIFNSKLPERPASKKG